MVLFPIPIMLARIEDRLFLGLTPERAKAWPAQLRAVLNRAQDVTAVPWRFLHFLVTASGIPKLDAPIIKAPVAQCADILCARARGEQIGPAAAVVRSTRRAAFKAGLHDAGGVRFGTGEASAYCAALAVEATLADSEDDAAAKAIDAIEAAEWAVRAGDEPALYSRMADKLIQLIEQQIPQSHAARWAA